jgi:RHS repeat-associated protein
VTESRVDLSPCSTRRREVRRLWHCGGSGQATSACAPKTTYLRRARRVILSLVCLLVLLGTASTATADKIAFDKSVSHENDGLWTADAATGENQVQVPGTVGYGWPALSPSGTQIGFESGNFGFNLYVGTLNGSEKTFLASSEGGALSWSPDGQYIAYVSKAPQKIYVVNVATREVRALGGPGLQTYPCWSRDGRYIAFSVREEEGKVEPAPGLYYINADGSGSAQPVILTRGNTLPGECSFGAGDLLAMTYQPPPIKEGEKEVLPPAGIFSVHLNGSGLTKLVENVNGHAEEPEWNKTGTKIAYDHGTEEEGRNLCSDIHTVNADGSGDTILLKGVYPVCYYEPSYEEPYLYSVPQPQPEELFGPNNPALPGYSRPCAGKPVNCATGNEALSQTDLAIGGRGLGLKLERTYNAQGAVSAKPTEPFGRGWSTSFSDHLIANAENGTVQVVQANGSAVVFKGTPGQVGAYTAPEWAEATLSLTSEHTYVYTLPGQRVFKFAEEGRLLSEADRNGNTTTLAYNANKQLETVTDPAGRQLTFAHNSEGFVESAMDPMGHTVKYSYESGNLASVTEPGEATPRWQFKYDGSHRLTKVTNGRGGATTNEYDSLNRVVSQTDPAERTLGFEYGALETKITNKAAGAVTKETFTKGDELQSITKAFGTSNATTESTTYNEFGEALTAKDGNEHTTEYAYDGQGNRTKMVNPDKNETKWSYSTTHDVISTTTPKGETTTIKRDSHGNPEVIERPAPAGKTQTTKYKYNTLGELESVTDPLEHTTKYEYDSHGDRTAAIDPEGDKRTWFYDEDSRVTSSVSPRGNVEGAEATKYTTKSELDAQERPAKVTDPLGHETKYAYDANGNLESIADPNGHKTKYAYNADDEQTKVEEPNGATTETGYDGAGQVTSQTDGNKHTTKYVRNALEQVVELVDPLSRKTTKEYDRAGNLTKLTDPAKRVITNVYDPANLPKETTFSDGKTHAIQYEYDADRDPTKMVDGSGTSIYTYDQLDRLTESKDGHGDVTKYEYDLANEQTTITYPNGKAVTRSFDKAGRLEKVTDWLEHVTKFSYNPDSDQTATALPSGTTNEDRYSYDEADRLSEVKMLKGTETLASLAYTRDNDGQAKAITSNGLPGEEKPAYEYDPNNRLTKAGTTGYEYDSADNPTKAGATTNTFDNADQLKTAGTTTYGYDELGERSKMTPPTGAATTYTYDQAGNLIANEKPKEGKAAGLTDTYTYDGTGLRVSQTLSGTKAFLAWEITEPIPLILNDGTNSFIYGPGGLPVEQINSSTGTVLYLHHDQAGSTRMLTNSTGAKEASFTYDAYGNTTGTTGTAKTPLGYDGQYTSTDTGLIYLRARVYDPATAQFLSVDPMVGVTRAPYNYANDNPLNHGDASGLSSWNPFSESFWTEGNVISESPLNPIPYYEKEIESYENGCGYLASVAHGLEGAVAGAALFAGGEGDAAEGGAAAIEAEITGFTRHGLAQAISREGVGVNEQAMLDAVNAPMKVINQADGTTRFVGKDASVVLNKEGRVVTTWANGSAGTRIQP